MGRLPAALCGFLLVYSGIAVPARSQGRELLVLNRGSVAIFAVQLGHVQGQTWGTDLLPFNDVVDVGEGKEVPLTLTDECVFDVRASYADGSTSDLTNVDLCVRSSVSFDR